MLEQVSEPVVIFIDEIDSTLNLDFTDDFFAAIRACYNARASDPAFKRLSFVLLGVATPGDLISDPQRTPFNIGQRMDLTDFTERQAISLADGLGLPPVEAGQVLTWILDWTGGHPYLTQRLCAAVATSPTEDWDAAAVDKLVEKTFLGEQSAQDSNLRFVRDMLTQRAPDKAAVLKTYRRIHAGQAVPDEERSPVKTHLKLSGIVKTEDGYLRVRNEIYRRVFDLDWVRENTAVNWAPIVAGIAVFVALLAIGSILYNAWVGIQFQDCVANFYQTNAPEKRVAHLAKMFRLQGLLGPTDYDYRARELFYGLSRKEQLALFSVSNVEDSDLIVVMKGLYTTLADTDGTDSTRPLLEAMAKALGDLHATEETKKLEGEINSWLEGRKLAKQSQDSALAEYNKAIALNGENPATLYERARVLTKLSKYQQALGDLDQVMAIARRAPAPTPTVSLTTTPAASPSQTTKPTASPTLTPTSTSKPGVDVTPTKTSPSASVTATSALLPTSIATPVPIATPTPASIISEFATIGQMISAVRNVIYGDPDLANSLARAQDSEYPNLREFGLVPVLTPTIVPTPTLTPIIIAVTTATLAPTSTPTPIPAVTTSTTVPTIELIPTETPTPTPTFTPTPEPTPTPNPILLGSVEVLDVDINPRNGQEIYTVVRGQGIYRTTDGGYRWQLINAFPNVESLTLGRAKPQTVFAAAERVVWRSTDGGANWQSIEIRNQRTGLALKGAVHVLAIAPNSDRIIYAGTDEGVYRSDDGGATWETRNGGMGSRPIYALVVASGDGQLVYAVGRGAEIWRTLDGGNLWSQLLCCGGIEGIYALALHPASDYEKNWLYIGADNSTVAVSVDGGRNWRPIMLGEEKPLYLRAPLKVSSVIILDFRDSETVLLAATGDRDNLSRNGIYKSTDGGLSWRPVNNGLPTDSSGTYSVHSIAVDPQNNQVVYAGTFVGLYKSTDGGESWAMQ